MTLILGCLTDDYIVVAADRRLTMPDGTIVDDLANKLIYFAHRAVVCFAGLATLDGRPTDVWLREILVGFDTLDPALQEIERRLHLSVARSGATNKGIAIAAMGWATFFGKPPIRPYVACVSNYVSADGWLPVVQDKFEYHVFPTLHGQSHQLFIAGQPVSPLEGSELDKLIRKCLRHRVGPRAFARIVGDTVRLFGDHPGDPRGKSIGPGPQIVSLVRSAVESRSHVFLTPLHDSENSWVD